MLGRHLPATFGSRVSSVADGTRPANAWGTSVTPGNNTYGSYANLGVLSSTVDGYGLWINVNSGATAGSVRDMIVTIGIDTAGGTSFVTLVPDLLASCSGGYQTGGGAVGVDFYFPLRIPAGASIGAKASVNNGTVGTVRVQVATALHATRPHGSWFGSKVTAYGVTAASSSGTAVTPGTTSEGSWTAISGTLTENIRYIEFGLGCSSSAMTNNVVHLDVGVGDASNKKLAVANANFVTTLNETIQKPLLGQWCDAAVGDILYARLQTGPNAADTGMSVAAYGVS